MRPILGHHRPSPGVYKFVAPTPNEGQVLQPTYTNFMGGESFAASFQVHAHLYSANMRYRQYVKGFFKYNGVPQPQPLFGGNMDPNIFMEDGNANGIYGGPINTMGLSVYSIVVAPGNIRYRLFRAWDTPGDNLVGCAPGTVVEINLTFKGVICDTAGAGNIYDQRIWHVRGTFTRP